MVPSISRTTRRIAVGAAAAAAAVAMTATPASAAPTGLYADFAQCPTSIAGLNTCLVSDTTSGEFKLGNTTVPINKRIRLQGGYVTDPNTGETSFKPAKNGQTLERTALNVPGGLLGITVPSLVPQPIRGLLEAGINTVNGVKATAELVAPVQFSFNNFINQEGIAVTLPLRVKLDNPFLGDNCYIGSSSSPVRLRLTTGTTAPPAGVAPLSGSFGQLDFLDSAQLITATGDSLVDNTFAAPKASGCGGPAFSWAIDPVVNLKVGLPAAAGVSYARFNGNAKLGAASAVIASEG